MEEIKILLLAKESEYMDLWAEDLGIATEDLRGHFDKTTKTLEKLTKYFKEKKRENIVDWGEPYQRINIARGIFLDGELFLSPYDFTHLAGDVSTAEYYAIVNKALPIFRIPKKKKYYYEMFGKLRKRIA